MNAKNTKTIENRRHNVSHVFRIIQLEKKPPEIYFEGTREKKELKNRRKPRQRPTSLTNLMEESQKKPRSSPDVFGQLNEPECSVELLNVQEKREEVKKLYREYESMRESQEANNIIIQRKQQESQMHQLESLLEVCYKKKNKTED